MYKKIATILVAISVVVVASYFTLGLVLVPSTTPLLRDNIIPNQVVLTKGGKVKVVTNKQWVDAIHSYLLGTAEKVNAREADKLLEQSLVHLMYSDKEPEFIVDIEGRIMTSIPKSEIRNRSRLHWLWWKIDSVLGDGENRLYYVTSGDKLTKVNLQYLLKEVGLN